MVASFLGKVTGLMGPLSLRWCHHLSTGVSNLHEILVFFFFFAAVIIACLAV